LCSIEIVSKIVLEREKEKERERIYKSSKNLSKKYSLSIWIEQSYFTKDFSFSFII